MKKAILFVFAILAVMAFAASPVMAQGGATAFVGYSAGRIEAGTDRTPGASQGAVASAAFPAFWRFQAKFEFGNQNRPANVKTYLGGVQVDFLKRDRVTVFGHALVGVVQSEGTRGATATAGPVSISNSAFAAQAGGGIDVRVAGGFGIRIAQVDYLRAPVNATGSRHAVRAASGIVLRF